MGRKRKHGADWLPPRVYQGKSAFELHPAGGGAIRLAPLTASKAAVIRRYDEEIRKLNMLSGSFSELVSEFFQAPAYKELAPSTQKKYLQNAKKPLAVFGKVPVKAIKPEDVRAYMDKRGSKTKVTANREHSFMSKVFSWGYERGKLTINPCKGVRKFTETARDRYITDEEYMAVFTSADPICKAVMELSYCCAARVSDVLAMESHQLLDEGIYIKQGKTGKAQIKAWSDRLRKAIEVARSYQSTRSLTRVIANEHGQRLTYDAFRERWNKAKTAAKEAYPGLSFDFTFHDIKAKSVSDYTGNKQAFTGHKSAQMIDTYDRKVPVVDTH